MDSIRRLFFWWLWPVLTKEKAVQTAKEVAAKENWPWIEPVEVCSYLGVWIIYTNSEWMGMNVRIEVDKNTGKVIRAGYNPR